MAGVQYEVKMMDHTGGSKFYETAWFASGENFISVFRWGKMAEKMSGGGQTEIKIHLSLWKAQQACENKQNEKHKRGYELSGGPGGGSVVIDMIALVLGKHYANAETIDRICELLGAESGVDVGIAVPDDVVEDAPEIIRGEDWGSW